MGAGSRLPEPRRRLRLPGLAAGGNQWKAAGKSEGKENPHGRAPVHHIVDFSEQSTNTRLASFVVLMAEKKPSRYDFTSSRSDFPEAGNRVRQRTEGLLLRHEIGDIGIDRFRSPAWAAVHPIADGGEHERAIRSHVRRMDEPGEVEIVTG